MGIFTFKAKKIHFFSLAFLLGLAGAFAQCPTVSNPSQSFCDLQSPTVASLVATNNGGGVVWYANATGGSPLPGSAGLVSGENYFADSSAGCGNRQEVTVTIYGAPAGLNFQGVCVGVASDAQIGDLQAVGNNIQWYTAPSGGSPLPVTTQLVDNTIYYASQTNPDTGCETSRLSVFVNVGVVPTPTGPPVQQFCNNPGGPTPTIADLVASGVNNWYPTSTSAVQLATSTPLVNGQSYFATTVDPPCESQSRLEVVVQLLPLNNAGTNGVRSICANQVATTAPFNLFQLLGGTPNNTGIWTGPIATTNGANGTLNPASMTLAGSPYVFTYTVNNGVCAPASSTATITILPLPTASVSGNTTICSGASATVTFSGTPNATVSYNNGGGNQTVLLNGSGTATITNTYTSTTTFTLISVASAGTPSCSQPLNGSVTINVLPLPTASIGSNVTVCSGGNATVTFTGTPGATVTYNAGSGNQTIVLNASGTATITNSYTITTTFTLVSVASSGSPVCTRPLTGSVTVTVIPTPTATITGSATICQNGSATVTFTGTPNATVTYTVSGLPGSQTIVLNGSGNATITNNYSTSTTFTLVSVATAGTPSCTRPVSGMVTISVLPPPTANISSNVTICSGAAATITFSGTANATVTYNAGSGNQTIVLNGSGTASITATYTSTTTITLVSVASSGTPSCVQPLTGSITVTVVPPPVVTISSNVTICSGGTATTTFTGTPNASVVYHVGNSPNQTIVLNGAGTASITGTYNTTTTITLVSATSNGTPACSQPQTGSITITVVPPPSVAISASQTICSGASATVTFTGTPNATVTYNTGSGNQTIVLNASGTATITNTYTTTTTFTLVSVTTSGTPACTQPATGSVTINVVPLPTVSIASSVTVCSGGSATVTLTGTPNATVTYNTGGANQTIVLNSSGTATITNTYTATTTFNLVSVTSSGTPSCTRPISGSVTVTVVPLPVVTIASNQTICSGGSATVTFTGTPNATVTYNTGGANQTVVLNASGTATITNTYTTSTTFNLVSITSPGTPNCTAPVSGSVTITVIPPPTVSIGSSASVCPNGSATVTFTGTPGATVTYTVTGTPGNQTIILNASGTASITNTFTTTTTYTLEGIVSTGAAACAQPASGSITITVLPPPTVTIAGNASVCSGGSATITFTGTPNAVITYNTGGANQTITLDGSGIATISGTFTATTTYTLVSASTVGSPGCSQPQTGSVTVAVIPPPYATISTNISVCSGQNATVTFTGTPNATVTYTVSGVPGNQTIVLNGAGTATITNAFTASTTYTLISVASAGTPSCTVTTAGTMVVTVVPLPVVAISSTTSSVCSGTASTVTFTGTPNALVTYNNGSGNQTVTLNSSGTATVTATLTGTTTYTLVSVSTTGSPACSQPQAGSVTITVTPPPVAGNDVANLALCASGPPVDLFSLLGTSAQTGGIWSPALASGTGVFNPAVDAPGTYIYTVTGSAPCPNDTASVTVTVLPPPNAGNDTAVAICSNAPSQDLFASLGAAAQPGGTWSPTLASGTGVFNPLVDVAGTYTYTVTGVAPCGSDSATVTVSITQAANAGQDASVAICATGPSQNLFNSLGGTPQAGGSWSPALASGTGVFNPAVDAAGTYTYTVGGTPPCANDTATVTVSITPPPTAGNDASLNICSNANPQDLFVLLGASAQPGGTWSPALQSGTGIFNPAVDPAGIYTYTVNGISPCGSDAATVAVTITPGPDAGQNGTMTVCANSAPQDLFNFLGGTPQVGGTWSPVMASGTGVFNPAVDAPGVYTYTFFGNQPCDNDTATVTVTVNPIPDAGNDGTAFFCSNYPASDLFNSLGGTPQTGGIWSPPLASGTGVFNPLVDAPGTYTYSVGGNLCSLDQATVTVSVVQSPNAGGVGQTLLLNECTTATSVDLFTALNGSQGVGTWADDDASGALSGNIFNPSLVAPGTYHFTYTVSGGTSPCDSDAATVTVIVAPVPNAGTFGGVQSVCSSAQTFDLTTLLVGEQPGGVWTDAANATVVNPIDISSLAAGSYTYSYTIANACGTDGETVQLTILPIPVLAIPNITLVTPICIGDSATINLSGMADGTYTITYDLSGSNSAIGLTAGVSITGGIASFNIPSANLTNTGTTTITFTNIVNTVTNCSNTLTGVQVNVVIRQIPNLASADLSGANVCLGSNVTVNIAVVNTSAGGLADGNYQFTYNLPGATPSTATTGTVAIASNAGQFSIPASFFATAGSYTLTITGIISLSSGCNNLNENASVSFTINPTLDVSGATVSAQDSCLNFSNDVAISGADNLPDGTYTVDYVLSGANAATGSLPVNFVGGDASFTIPAPQLVNAGTVTLNITQLTSGGNPCGAGGTAFNSVTFTISQLGTPVLEAQGNEFCGADLPTIAQLSANIQGSEPVIWYNAPNGGTPYASSDLLVDGATYYATYTTASGCESPTRLAVTVDLSACLDIIIPDGFSPNNDGINDDFEVVNLPELYPNYRIEIYNRYGNILYKGDINTPNWDGTASQGGIKLGNGVCPVGVYFFIIEFNDGARQPVQGRVYLSR